MEFITELLDEQYTYNCKITNRFNTTITISKNGIESRLRNWNNYLKKYDITYNVRTNEEIDYIRQFFNKTSGAYLGFLFKDWTDYLVNARDLKIKNVYKNYVRIYSTKNNRKIDSFKQNDFLKASEKIKQFDNKNGKIMLAHKFQFNIIQNEENLNYNSLTCNQFTEEIFQHYEKSGFIYCLNNNEKELELKITKIDKQNKKIFFINNKKENLNLTKVNIYNYIDAELDLINNDYQDEIEYYHVVRFEDDDFMITVDDYNINSTSINLVELKIKD